MRAQLPCCNFSACNKCQVEGLTAVPSYATSRCDLPWMTDVAKHFTYPLLLPPLPEEARDASRSSSAWAAVVLVTNTSRQRGGIHGPASSLTGMPASLGFSSVFQRSCQKPHFCVDLELAPLPAKTKKRRRQSQPMGFNLGCRAGGSARTYTLHLCSFTQVIMT